MNTLFDFLFVFGIYGVGSFCALSYKDKNLEYSAKLKFAIMSAGLLAFITTIYCFIISFPVLVWVIGASILSLAMFKEKIALIDGFDTVMMLAHNLKAKIMLMYEYLCTKMLDYKNKAVKLLPWIKEEKK